MNILITGGTGLIGQQLGLELIRKGHRLIGITRNAEHARKIAPYPADWIECDLAQSIPTLHNHKIDGVIHLAGESVGDKAWTEEQKNKIRESRSQGTQNLMKSLASKELSFFITASAIGLYGATEGDYSATETTAAADTFLAEVTKDWENQSTQLQEKVRTVVFRIGVVLSTEGGALPKMLFPAQIFASSALGNGKQWMSWIHLHDVVRAFVTAAESRHYSGVYNLVAPHPCQQKVLAEEIARQLNSLSGPPVPGFALKLLLGEQAQLALISLKVSAEKLLKSGFSFHYPQIDQALSDLLGDWKNGQAVKTFRQFFPLPREKVFPFFSEAKNLEKITPESLHFHILKMSTPEIQKGTLLDYKLKIHGFPVYWQTRIETWKANEEFTDTQLKGPYSLWHHTHSFEDLAGGTLMVDRIRYKVPVGLLGRLVSQAFVDNDIDKIFKYRREVVPDLLNKSLQN